MNRTRLVIGLQLGLGLICAGLGHYYTALFRTVYPLDGLVYYAAAVVCFVLAWRTAQHEQNAVWQALIDLWREAWREIRALLLESARSLRPALPYISMRGLVIGVVGVNVAVAILAELFPEAIWLWGVAWGATLLALIVYLLPRVICSIRAANGSTAGDAHCGGANAQRRGARQPDRLGDLDRVCVARSTVVAVVQPVRNDQLAAGAS